MGVSVGRDVRSTPMQWSYEGKKLSCAVNHLSWRPPWVRARDSGQEEESDPRARFLGMNERVVDTLGRGRVPVSWWTQNCAYNSAYDIHRLNANEFALAYDSKTQTTRKVPTHAEEAEPGAATGIGRLASCCSTCSRSLPCGTRAGQFDISPLKIAQIAVRSMQ